MKSKKNIKWNKHKLVTVITLLVLLTLSWSLNHSLISASSAQSYAFPLAYTNGYGGDWLADRCSGTGSGENHLHGGTDIMHKKGEKVQVFAVVEGYIYFSDTNHIRLVSTKRGDKHTYYYNHLSSTNIKKGDKVKAGQLIGYSGGTNSGANGDHTHFGILSKPDSKVEIAVNSCDLKKSKRPALARKQGLTDPTSFLKKTQPKKSKKTVKDVLNSNLPSTQAKTESVKKNSLKDIFLNTLFK